MGHSRRQKTRHQNIAKPLCRSEDALSLKTCRSQESRDRCVRLVFLQGSKRWLKLNERERRVSIENQRSWSSFLSFTLSF